jgi:hypothetical protein
MSKCSVTQDEEEAVREVQALVVKADEMLDTIVARLDSISVTLQEVINYVKARPEVAKCVRE